MNNFEMLELAKDVFGKYDLPNGAQVVYEYGRLQVSYCYINGKGAEDMKQIIAEVDPSGETVRTDWGNLVVDKRVQVKRRWVEVRAQMEIVDEKPRVSQSAKKKALKAVGL